MKSYQLSLSDPGILVTHSRTSRIESYQSLTVIHRHTSHTHSAIRGAHGSGHQQCIANLGKKHSAAIICTSEGWQTQSLPAVRNTPKPWLCLPAQAPARPSTNQCSRQGAILSGSHGQSLQLMLGLACDCRNIRRVKSQRMSWSRGREYAQGDGIFDGRCPPERRRHDKRCYPAHQLPLPVSADIIHHCRTLSACCPVPQISFHAAAVDPDLSVVKTWVR